MSDPYASHPVVLKFGGTSMKDHLTWSKVLSIANGIADREGPVVVVVSATSGTTRQLVGAAKLAAQGRTGDALEIVESIRERHSSILTGFAADHGGTREQVDEAFGLLHDLLADLVSMINCCDGMGIDHADFPAAMDGIAGIGEEISSGLLATCAGWSDGSGTGGAGSGGMATDGSENDGLPRADENLFAQASHMDSRKVIITDERFGSARPDRAAIRSNIWRIREMLGHGRMVVMGGYIGSTPDGRRTTLGFEGSDLTATLLGDALDASRVEIWTDVSGVHTSDPRRIPAARSIPRLSLGQAAKMAQAGASVLHPDTLDPVMHRGIPVWVKNLFHPDHPGTVIGADLDADLDASSIKALGEAPSDTPAALAITFPAAGSETESTVGVVGLNPDMQASLKTSLGAIQQHIGTSIPIRWEERPDGTVHLTVSQEMGDRLAMHLHRVLFERGESSDPLWPGNLVLAPEHPMSAP